MGLIVRDECERSVKNQVSKVEQVDIVLLNLLSIKNKFRIIVIWKDNIVHASLINVIICLYLIKNPMFCT